MLVRLRQHQNGEISTAAFDAVLSRLNLARRHGVKDLLERHPDLKGYMEAIGVMDLIDSHDKVYYEPKMKGLFRDDYEWLSEFCHPNLFSRIASGHDLQGREIFSPRTPRTTEADVSNALSHGSVSHLIFFHCYAAIAELIGGVPPQSD
jgi:hypothetical protein